MRLALFTAAALYLLRVVASPETTTGDDSLDVDSVDVDVDENDVTTESICGNSFRYFGVSESGAEANPNRLPGTAGSDYTWPSAESADYFLSKGFNTIRIPFLMERLSSGGFKGNFDTVYFFNLKTAVSYVTGRGSYAILDPHNFGRYNGSLLDSISEFGTWWGRFAREFQNDNRVIFEVMHSPLDLDSYQVADLNVAAIKAIRNAGATSQLILVEGAERSTAVGWIDDRNADAVTRIKDPANNFAFALRTGFDASGYGTSPDCVSTTIGTERLRQVTDWLRSNGQRGFLIEFASGPSSTCIAAVAGALCGLQQSNVWIGATWWAAGPASTSYFGSIEPPNGPAVSQILPQALQPFV